MVEILVTIENEKYEKPFISLLQELKYISSFSKAKGNKKKLKPLTNEDWIKPGRPATEEEIYQMLEKAEQGPSFTLEEAKAETLKYLNELRAANL
ncbi:MAG: hypothetical protein HW421_3113 [Ignavibacteria bacterium]|nr:hypothetical protein [Ignavibacteria bacterium]